MFSRFPEPRRTPWALPLAPLAIAAALAACGSAEGAPARELRVCADPNNLPFTNARGEGFENALAEMMAREMGARLVYTWHAQRRGFIRNTLRAGECDVVMGIPSSLELALATKPYYRSTYVFVTRTADGPDVRSFDDPVLRTARIGVHLVGDDGANAPPAHALGNRGIVGNVRGYTVYGDYAQESPPARILDALAAGEIDVAIVWGPLAGYFAPLQPVALTVVPVSPQIDPPFLPFVFDISMGVRRGDDALKDELEDVLERNRPEVEGRYALWHRAAEAPVVVGLHTDRREVLLTTVLDAEPESRHEQPGPTIWPLAAALAVGVFFIGSIFSPWGAVVGSVLLLPPLVLWGWPRGRPEHEKEDEIVDPEALVR